MVSTGVTFLAGRCSDLPWPSPLPSENTAPSPPRVITADFASLASSITAVSASSVLDISLPSKNAASYSLTTIGSHTASISLGIFTAGARFKTNRPPLASVIAAASATLSSGSSNWARTIGPDSGTSFCI